VWAEDTVHPTDAGSDLLAAQVIRHVKCCRRRQVGSGVGRKATERTADLTEPDPATGEGHSGGAGRGDGHKGGAYRAAGRGGGRNGGGGRRRFEENSREGCRGANRASTAAEE
jgi:hypothetical protein